MGRPVHLGGGRGASGRGAQIAALTLLRPTASGYRPRHAAAPRGVLERRPSLGLWLELAAVAVLVVASRAAWSMRAFDVFVDEVTYLRLAESVSATGLPVLYDEPFYLHPPGGFVLQTLVAAVVGWPDDVFDAVHQQRLVVAACAGVTAVGLRLLGGRLGGALVGRAAVVVLLLDPVSVRLTSRNLLEAPTLMWLVLGLLVLVGGNGPPSRRRSLAGGALLGLAVLTKDTALLVTALPLLAAAALGWWPRRAVVLTQGSLAAVYSTYLVWVAANGQLLELLRQKTVGLSRLSGTTQLTGFNAPGSTPFVEQVLSRAVQLGPSYALLAAGGVAGLLLLRVGRGPGDRLLGLWVTAAAALSGWTVLRGTLEEQLFYQLLVPAAVAVPLVVRRLRHRLRGVALDAVVAVATAWVVVAAFTWGDVRATRDDSFERVTDEVLACCSTTPLTTVAVLSDPGDVLLRGVDVVLVSTAADLRAEGADLLLVSSRSLEDGTARPDPALARIIVAAPVVTTVNGPSVGALSLLDVRGL